MRSIQSCFSHGNRWWCGFSRQYHGRAHKGRVSLKYTKLVRLFRTAFKIKLSLCVVLYRHDKRPIMKVYVSLKSCSATSRCSHHSQASPSIFVHNGAFLKCKYLNWVFIHFHLRTRWTCWLSLHDEKKKKKNLYSHRKPHKRQREQGSSFRYCIFLSCLCFLKN